jgi:hypothetical protein
VGQTVSVTVAGPSVVGGVGGSNVVGAGVGDGGGGGVRQSGGSGVGQSGGGGVGHSGGGVADGDGSGNVLDDGGVDGVSVVLGGAVGEVASQAVGLDDGAVESGCAPDGGGGDEACAGDSGDGGEDNEELERKFQIIDRPFNFTHDIYRMRKINKYNFPRLCNCIGAASFDFCLPRIKKNLKQNKIFVDLKMLTRNFDCSLSRPDLGKDSIDHEIRKCFKC